MFCFKNCSNLREEKNVLGIEKNFRKFEAKGQVLLNFRSPENSKRQNHKDDCAHFCGLLRKAEL